MKLSDKGYALLKRSEGFRANTYKDVAGHPTIGYGHKLLIGEDFAGGITQAEGDLLLRGDVAEAEGAVTKLVTVPLTQGQFDALVDFVYNLGAGRLATSTLRKVLNKGQYDEACDWLEKWDHAGNVEVQGLKTRRLAEQELWRS